MLEEFQLEQIVKPLLAWFEKNARTLPWRSISTPRPGVLVVWCGGVLLSHTLSGAVPSPCQVLASGFGMGPGVSPGPWPPQILGYRPGNGVSRRRVAVRGPDNGRDSCCC